MIDPISSLSSSPIQQLFSVNQVEQTDQVQASQAASDNSKPEETAPAVRSEVSDPTGEKTLNRLSAEENDTSVQESRQTEQAEDKAAQLSAQQAYQSKQTPGGYQQQPDAFSFFV